MYTASRFTQKDLGHVRLWQMSVYHFQETLDTVRRSYHIRRVLALICISAFAWMVAQPQSAAAMPSAQDSATATIQGTVLKPDDSPAIGAEMTVGMIGYEELPDGSIGYGELSERSR